MEMHNLHPAAPHALLLNDLSPMTQRYKDMYCQLTAGKLCSETSSGYREEDFHFTWFSQVVGWWKVSWEALRAVGCMFSVQLLSPPFGKVRNFHIPCLQVLGYTHILSPNTSVHVAQPLHGGIVPSRRCDGQEPCWELHLVGQYCPWGMLLQDKSLFMLLILSVLALSCFLGRGPNNDHGHLWC